MFNQNSVSALKTEFDKLSEIMGKKGIRTTFIGDGAYTDGKTINLPAMDMSATMSARDQAIARGYHIHEVGHVTDTDFGLTKAQKPQKNLHGIWNACEDVLVERKACEKYSGAKRNLSATVDSVLESENKHWEDNPKAHAARRKTWWTEVPYAALQQARKDAGYMSGALDEYIENMPDDLAVEARKFAKEMTAAADTGESYELAKKISKRVKALAKKHGTQEEDGDTPAPTQKPATGKSEGEATGDSEATGKPEQGDGDESDGGGNGDGDDSDSDGDNDGGGGGKGDDSEPDPEPDTTKEPEPEPKGFSMEDAEDRKDKNMQDIFGKYSGKAPNGRDICTELCRVHDTHKELWIELELETREVAKAKNVRIITDLHLQADVSDDSLRTNNAYYRKHLGKDVQAYGARLARLLMSQESKRNEGGYSSGRIDRRRLSQLVAGNENIFSRTEDVATSETRIMLAIDGSSSMYKMQTNPAVHVVNDALGRAGVKFDVSEWGGLLLHKFKGSVGGLPWIVRHKQAHQNYRKLQTLLNFQPVGGDTPTYAALQTYAGMMQSWTEPRKILLMLTDGDPNGAYHERVKCRKLVVEMEAIGIEVIGVGIGMDVSSIFSKHVQTDFAKLGETLLGSLEKLLLSQGHAHA
jgi:cobaltochelatase CobT